MSHTYVPTAVRRLVAERAAGCCEYCRTPENVSFVTFQIDHVISEKHGGVTEAENLAYSCALCNKFKGSDVASIDPTTGEVVRLFNPRRDDWKAHFELRANGEIRGRTASGRATVRLLRFADSNRVRERRLLIDMGELAFPNTALG